MYGCESWTVKQAEHHGIDAFELWSWRRLLRVSWTARRSNQSILKEISPEYGRTDTFELWFWKRCKRVPGTARSNQRILKEIYPKYSLEGLMLKLKVQYFDHLMQRADSMGKTLMLCKIEGRGIPWDEMVGWNH